MPKRMNDDEVMDYVYGKLFGDLDGLESGTMFSDKGEDDVQGIAPNAEPDSKEAGGMKITIEPLMAAAQEGPKPSDDDEEDDEDKLKGIGGMSPLMAQLHGER